LAHPYYRTIFLIERLHRYFLEVVKAELDRRGVEDINNVQALILYNIGESELTVGELTAHGYYLGSNVSYNVRRMTENGYLEQHRSPHDRRSVRVRASAKGLETAKVLGAVFDQHVAAMAGTRLTEDGLAGVNETMASLERFWAGRLALPATMLSGAE